MWEKLRARDVEGFAQGHTVMWWDREAGQELEQEADFGVKALMWHLNPSPL